VRDISSARLVADFPAISAYCPSIQVRVSAAVPALLQAVSVPACPPETTPADIGGQRQEKTAAQLWSRKTDPVQTSTRKKRSVRHGRKALTKINQGASHHLFLPGSFPAFAARRIGRRPDRSPSLDTNPNHGRVNNLAAINQGKDQRIASRKRSAPPFRAEKGRQLPLGHAEY